MAKKRRTITKKQSEVLDDLFTIVANEQQILKKHKVDKRLYDRWLADENFVKEFERRLDTARRQGELIIARFANVAAAKLVELTNSESQETARKACLDIINYLKPDSGPEPADKPDAEQLPDLLPELASRLLAALAKNDEQRVSSSA
jgi:hypothetical protein